MKQVCGIVVKTVLMINLSEPVSGFKPNLHRYIVGRGERVTPVL